LIYKYINLIKTWVRLRNPRTWVIALVAVSLLVYIVLWIIPRPLALSYASERTCIVWPTFLPGVQKTVDGTKFSVSTEGGLQIGSIRLLSTHTCIEPVKNFNAGRTTVALSPFGGWLFQQRIMVVTSNVPSVSLNTDSPIPAMRTLELKLDTPDVLYTYHVQVGKEIAPCQAVLGKALLSCGLAPLALLQGRQYQIEVLRSFRSEAPSAVLKAMITTLTATTIVNGSVGGGDTVYAKPMEFTFTADKPLKSAIAILTQEGAVSATGTTTVVKGKVITIKLAGELLREKAYILKITNLEAADGSSLVEPYIVAFHTSGGPKVTNVSVGSSGVATNAHVVVTFDQQLSDSQDISKLVVISGVNAQITRSGNQIIYTLSAGLCVPFTLSVAKGLLSSYDIASVADWSYTSRTICHTTLTYGYSVHGRALVAYAFGTGGPVTMYVGAIHGNEPSSSGLMRAWTDDLEANPSLYSGKRVVVVPTINPDGVAANTRTNAHGVNLNRNFPTDGWVKDINDTDGYHAGGGGSEPLSEPEARALASLTTSWQPRLLLSFHAVGSLVMGDPGGYSAGYAAKYASMVGYSDTTYSLNGGFDYNITGAYEDWTASKQGIPSMVIELGSYGYYSFSHHQAALRAMLN